MVTKIGSRKISANASAIGNAVKGDHRGSAADGAGGGAYQPQARPLRDHHLAPASVHRADEGQRGQPQRGAEKHRFVGRQRTAQQLHERVAARIGRERQEAEQYTFEHADSGVSARILTLGRLGWAPAPPNDAGDPVLAIADAHPSLRTYNARGPRYNNGFYATVPGASMAVSLNPLDLYDVRSLLTDEERMVQDTVAASSMNACCRSSATASTRRAFRRS
jgi:hypothetical protein